MRFIFDLPISFYDHYPGNVVFALGTKIDQYKAEIGDFDEREVFLDNGAWIKDGGKSMDPGQYADIINEVNPKYAVVPDSLARFDESIKLAKEFFKIWNEVGNTGVQFIAPLQGMNITEILAMRKMYSEKTMGNKYGDLIYGLSKGGEGRHTPDRKICMKLISSEYPMTRFHLLGYDFGPFGVDFYSMDTKWPVKKALGHRGDGVGYYDVDYHMLSAEEKAQLGFWLTNKGQGWW